MVGLALAAAALVYDPSTEAAQPKRVAGLLLAAFVLAGWTVRPPRRALGTRAAGAALVFIGVSAASLAWGLPSGARDLGTLVGALGAGAWGASLGARLGARAARVMAVTAGGAASVWAIGEVLVGETGMQIHAGQGNPNWLGLLLAITLPLTIDAVLVAGRQRGVRAVAAMVGVAQIGALYLSHSRVGWAAAAVACVGYAVLAVGRGRPFAFAAIASVASIAVLAGALALRATPARVSVAPSRAPRAESAGSRDVPADLALRGRVWIWRGTTDAAVRALPFGAGLGGFGHAYLDAQGAALARLSPPEAARRFVNATTAHQDYLQAAVESGPLAALALAMALVLGVRDLARAGWMGGAASLGAAAVAALGDSPLRQPAVALIVGLVLGVSTTRAPRGARAPRARSGALVRIASGGLLALVAWLLVAGVREWTSTRERLRARDADPVARMVLAARAARMDPASGEAALDAGLALLAVGDPKGAQRWLARADALLADTGARIALGGAALAAGDAADAARAYGGALAWSPGSFRARLGLGEALLAAGDLDGAEREVRVAKGVLPGDPRVREMLDRIHEARMDRP